MKFFITFTWQTVALASENDVPSAEKTLVKQQVFIIVVFQDVTGFLETFVFIHHLCLQCLSLSSDLLLLLLYFLQPVKGGRTTSGQTADKY